MPVELTQHGAKVVLVWTGQASLELRTDCYDDVIQIDVVATDFTNGSAAIANLGGKFISRQVDIQPNTDEISATDTLTKQSTKFAILEQQIVRPLKLDGAGTRGLNELL